MIQIERQIGSEDPRLWMIISRTIDLTMSIDKTILVEYLKNIGDDAVYWPIKDDGSPDKDLPYRVTETCTLVTKLYYRLLDALEDEALAFIETQSIEKNGCEILRLLKVRYGLETQYIETDLITKVHTWTFDQQDLENR